MFLSLAFLLKIYHSSQTILVFFPFLPIQSPITNIVSNSSDTVSICSLQRLSFPPQTDMNSPDGPGFNGFIVRKPTGTRQTKQDGLFIEITTQPLDGSADNNTELHFEKIAP